MQKHILTLSTIIMALGFSSAAHAQKQEGAAPTTLYRLDCGDIHVTNLDVFSDTLQYVGKEKDLTVSCYVIKHGENVLLWDTGLPDALVGQENAGAPPFLPKKKATLAQELAKLNLKPEDITHVGISHAHFDHAANVAQFKNAKLIIQQAEYDFLMNHPEDAKAAHMDPEFFGDFLKPAGKDRLHLLKGDSDIFGDGIITALTLPGHTPGHMALLVKLKETGSVVLSGDQWHFDENHKNNGVPSFNHDRADTLASSDRLDTLIKNAGAKLIIQHEPKDQTQFPALPDGLK